MSKQHVACFVEVLPTININTTIDIGRLEFVVNPAEVVVYQQLPSTYQLMSMGFAIN